MTKEAPEQIQATQSLTCEESNMHGLNDKNGVPYPCGNPATHIMRSPKDRRDYAMCDMCADHNTRRGMVAVEFYLKKPEPAFGDHPAQQPRTSAKEESKELIVLPEINPVQVFGTEGGAAPILEYLRKQVLSVDRDYTSDKGRKAVRSLAARVRSQKSDLKESAKNLKSGLKKQVDLIDGEIRTLREGLELLEDEIMAPVLAFDAREEKRVEAHEAELTMLEGLTTFGIDRPALAEIERRQKVLTDHVRDWEEFAERAQQARAKVTEDLSRRHADQTKYEKDQADLQRLRDEESARQKQKELDDAAEKARLKAEQEAQQKAAEEAKRVEAERQFDGLYADAVLENAEFDRAAQQRAADAEKKRLQDESDEAARKAQAEQDRLAMEKQEAQARADKAEADKKAAEAKAEADRIENERKLKAQQDKAAADAKIAADKAEADKQAALKAQADAQAEAKRKEDEATKKREANVAHQKKINGEALADLQTVGVLDENKNLMLLTDEIAKVVIEAIARGKIRHITIKY